MAYTLHYLFLVCIGKTYPWILFLVYHEQSREGIPFLLWLIDLAKWHILFHATRVMTPHILLNCFFKEVVHVAEPPKLLGQHAPALVSKTSDDYACAQDNLIGSVRPKELG